MAIRSHILAPIFFLLFLVNQVNAKDEIHVYFSNDSINGLKLSDAYETHSMGLTYSDEKYYLKLDLGIVSPDMHVYRNEYREANRSFGELISLEIGGSNNQKNKLRFYTRIKAAGNFGVDTLQDFAHRFLSLQPVNSVNELIRMPGNVWLGAGLRSDFQFNVASLQYIEFNFDSFVGTDTAFLTTKLIKRFKRPILTYDLSVAARFVAYDKVVSAPPIYANERSIIPEISFGLSYKTGPYTIFVKDSFSLPSIEADSGLYGMLSAGLSYEF